MDNEAYVALWEKLSPSIIGAAQIIQNELTKIADGFTVSDVMVEIGDDSTGAIILLSSVANLSGNPDGVVSIKLVDDETGTGANIKFVVEDVASQSEIWTYIPYRYDPECFTRDEPELLRRIQEAPIGDIAPMCLEFMDNVIA